MKLEIRAEDANINLRLPTALVLNHFTANAVLQVLEENQLHLSRAALLRMAKAAKEYRKDHPEWCLLEVHSADGEDVIIRL